MIEGDARDEGAVTRALNDCDAVISALGTGMGFSMHQLIIQGPINV